MSRLEQSWHVTSWRRWPIPGEYTLATVNYSGGEWSANFLRPGEETVTLGPFDTSTEAMRAVDDLVAASEVGAS